MILDGYGLNDKTEGNAIAMANTPVMDKLMAECPWQPGLASGLAVGLPDGQMGNSEVGHMNIGAGRIIYQDLTRISINRLCPLMPQRHQTSLFFIILPKIRLYNNRCIYARYIQLQLLLLSRFQSNEINFYCSPIFNPTRLTFIALPLSVQRD